MGISIKRRFIFLILLLLVVTACDTAGSKQAENLPKRVVAAKSKDGMLTVSDAWANATGQNGAVYLTLKNDGNKADRLLSVESDVAKAVELHESKTGDGNMMQMIPVDEIEIPAGETVALEPGGLHIMLIELEAQPATDEKIQVTLNFKNSGLIPVDVPVALGAATTNEHEHGDINETKGDFENLAAVTLANGEKLKVVATTNIVGDLVNNVGGQAIDLTVMLPAGTDPHSFSPAPQDVVSVTDAEVVFINGLGLEEFLSQLIENAGSNSPVISLAHGVDTVEFFKEDNEHNHDPEDETHHLAGVDPHIWTSPANAKVMVGNVEHALSLLDPANAGTYKNNADAYVDELNILDEWVKAQVESIPAESRKMVTDHATFNYFTNRYGIELIGAVIPGYSTNAEPSAREVAQLQDAVNLHKVKAVFVGTTVNSVLAERLAQDSGVQLVPLYTGSLGKPGSGVETYLDYIRYNTIAIVDALK